MSWDVALEKMQTLTLLFLNIRFSSIPANIESPTVRVLPFLHCLIELDPAFSMVGYLVSMGTPFPFFLIHETFWIPFWRHLVECLFFVISADFSIVSSLVSLDYDWCFEVLAFLTQSFTSLHLLVTNCYSC